MIDKQHWPRVTFGGVVRLNTDRVADPVAAGIERFVGLEHIEPEDLGIRRWGLVADGTTFTNLFRPGQVLFGKRRAYQRKVAVADFEGVCSSDIYVFEPKDPNVLLPELLPFLCQTDGFFEHAVGTSAGSLSPRTNWTQLAAYEFALPPLEEQRRIAEVLTCSWLAIEAASNAGQRANELRAAALDELCGRNEGAVTQLGEICGMQNGRGFPGTDYQDHGIRLLRPGNLGANGYFDWNLDKTIHLPQNYQVLAEDYIVFPGDVVINLTAQSLEDGFMGRVCLARKGDGCLLNQRIGRFVFASTTVLPEYVFRVLQTSAFQQHAISMCEGTKVKHMYWRHLDRFMFGLPSLHRQSEIVETVGALDASVEACLLRTRQNQFLHQQLLANLMPSTHDGGPEVN